MLHWQRVSLELGVLVFVFDEGVFEDLDAAWLVLLLRTAAHASKDCSSVVHENHLLQTSLLFVPQHFFAHMVIAFLQLTQTSERVSCINDGVFGILRFVGRKTCEVNAFHFVPPDVLVFFLLVVQLPNINACIPAT